MVTTRRAAVSLDGTWEFIPDPECRFAPDRLPAGSPVPVPGPWEAAVADPYGIVRAWYRRRFTTPADWHNGTLLLRFGSVMARADVYLDRQLVGQHEDGYLPFELNTGTVRPGQDHELVVAIDNPVNALTEYPAADEDFQRVADERFAGRSFEGLAYGKQAWYTSTSGILGSVVAELAPDSRFAALVVLPDLAAAQVTVRWRLGGVVVADGATVDISVASPIGQIVAEASADAQGGSITLDIPDAEPWDVGRPALYRLNAQLRPDERIAGASPGGGVVDEATVRFGLRSIAVKDGAILLNGRSIYLRGALDQDFWPIGLSSAPSRSALVAQVRRAQEMGLNLLRCHLKVPDPAYLDVADEAGLLLWCELPSWRRFDLEAAQRARRMLGRMVETMGSHPSIVAWTVINEDWGTDLRHSSRDRHWLRSVVDELKTIDPSRLVVDNSACETGQAPNFHLCTDLADYHAYRSMPDGLPRWRALVGDFARRPAWLWSPNGDASPTGDEALVLSEFGAWGLPRPSKVRPPEGHEPSWWRTGEASARPAGIHSRFLHQRLDRIWPDVDALADATQWRQYAALAAQVQELRRHASIRGHVVTELSDTFWEANGLLDAERAPKAFHDLLGELNAPDVLIVDLPRSDLWGGERLTCEVTLSSFPDDAGRSAADQGELEWHLRLDDGGTTGGSATSVRWPDRDARVVAQLELDVPDVAAITSGELLVTARTPDESALAIYRQSVLVLPDTHRRSAHPRRIGVVDPVAVWSIADRLRGLGHAVVGVDEAALVVASQVDASLLAAVSRGTGLLLLSRSVDAIPAGLGLARSIEIRCRRPGDGTSPRENPWDGDWIGVFAWALPGVVPGLPQGGLLGDAQGQVYPDHVLVGPDPADPSDGVLAGMFAGWVHSPAALLVECNQGTGHLLVTTLQVAPEDGPVATVLLESLVQRALERFQTPPRHG